MNLIERMRRNAFLLPVAAVMAMALLFLSEVSYRASRLAMEEVSVVNEVSLDLRSLLQLMTDAETGVRGYILTGNKDYLQPYGKALSALPLTLRRLEQYYAGATPAKSPIPPVEALIAQRLKTLATIIQLYDSGERDQMNATIARESSRVNKTMAELRDATTSLVAAADARVERAHGDVTFSLIGSRIGIAATAALSVLLLMLYLRQHNAGERELAIVREAARAELQRQVESRTRDLAALARHLQTAREDERGRLARALHDELGALLTAAKLDVARIKMRLADTAPEAQERLVHLNDELNGVISLTRSITEDLRPSALGNLGLLPTLEILAREFGASSETRITSALHPVDLTPPRQLTVYRLVQEALTNVSKHARAQSVHIELAQQDGRAHISVADDGAGFDMHSTQMGSYGLLGMRYRVEGEGGRLEVRSAPGAGTRISATLPLDGAS